MSLFTNALFVLTLASTGAAPPAATTLSALPTLRVAGQIAPEPQGKGCCKKECCEKCGKKCCKSCKKC